MLLAGFGRFDVVIDDVGVITVATFDLRADYRRDLLRRPGRSSAAREALGGVWNVVYLDNDGARHWSSL